MGSGSISHHILHSPATWMGSGSISHHILHSPATEGFIIEISVAAILFQIATNHTTFATHHFVPKFECASTTKIGRAHV